MMCCLAQSAELRFCLSSLLCVCCCLLLGWSVVQLRKKRALSRSRNPARLFFFFFIMQRFAPRPMTAHRFSPFFLIRLRNIFSGMLFFFLLGPIIPSLWLHSTEYIQSTSISMSYLLAPFAVYFIGGDFMAFFLLFAHHWSPHAHILFWWIFLEMRSRKATKTEHLLLNRDLKCQAVVLPLPFSFRSFTPSWHSFWSHFFLWRFVDLSLLLCCYC